MWKYWESERRGNYHFALLILYKKAKRRKKPIFNPDGFVEWTYKFDLLTNYDKMHESEFRIEKDVDEWGRIQRKAGYIHWD